jgi:hypothetical protein
MNVLGFYWMEPLHEESPSTFIIDLPQQDLFFKMLPLLLIMDFWRDNIWTDFLTTMVQHQCIHSKF